MRLKRRRGNLREAAIKTYQAENSDIFKIMLDLGFDNGDKVSCYKCVFRVKSGMKEETDRINAFIRLQLEKGKHEKGRTLIDITDDIRCVMETEEMNGRIEIIEHELPEAKESGKYKAKYERQGGKGDARS